MSLGPIMMGLEGCELLPEEHELLQHPLLGGVILFSRNYESPEQLMALTDVLHLLRDPPLLVAVDQEGGRVQRFRFGFTALPAVAGLGRIHDRSPSQAKRLARTTGWLMAVELLCMGVDFSFAPVLDLGKGMSGVIGDRAFHHDPRVVSELAHHYILGMREAGMAATGKHFPGHGSVKEDSHHSLPVDARDYSDMLVEDLIPFERMVDDGIEAVMASHVLYANVDDKLAGYSHFWLQEVLRGRFGFQGVIFSDDLLMEAASVAGDIVDRGRSALDAGCDMALVCSGIEATAHVVDGLGPRSNPVSSLRLARMHGRKGLDYHCLGQDRAWQEAVRLVSEYDEPQALDLI